MDVFKIDGKTYNVEILSIKRKFSVLDSDKSSRSIAGDMTRSIIGTYYNYTVQIDTDRLSRAEYDTLYEILSAPQESHTVVLPYGQTTITQKMYVTGGEDTLLIDDAGNVWSGMSIDFVAISAKRKP